jgi:maltose alpha-D-glucosyltransferase/alpha-amylase
MAVRPLHSIYQVDPYLFRDSTGRGWGTLDGVTEKLDYLQWLGVSHVWLLPFYRNAGRDGGYDVTDHYRIDPRLGDDAAFQRLIDAAHARGIGIIAELIMQHTASAHPWFAAAQQGDPHWRPWYLWSDEVPDDGLQPMFPPIEASTWSWDAQAGAFNRHMFYRHEPDLELAHAPVRDELHRVMTHWLRRGVAGFRVDAVPYMVERARQADPRDDGLWLLEDMRATADAQQPGLPLIGEADVSAGQYGDFICQGRRLSHLLDFHLNNHFFLALARGDASEVARVMAEYGPHAPPGTRIAWLRNNDELDLEQLEPEEREEVMQRFAPDPGMRIYRRGIRRRLAPMLDGDVDWQAMAWATLLSLGQVPVIRYGEEIGLGDCLELPERNAVRMPMHWHDGPGAGFCDDPRHAWRAPPADGPFGYRSVSVAAQRDTPGSLLLRVRELLQQRAAHPVLQRGPHVQPSPSPALLVLAYDDGSAQALALINFALEEIEIDLAGTASLPPVVNHGARIDGTRCRVRGHGYAWLAGDAS